MASRFHRTSTALRAMPRATPSHKQRCAGLMGPSLRRAFARGRARQRNRKSSKRGIFPMPKCCVFSAILLTALLSSSPLLRAQNAPGTTEEANQGKWNNGPPAKKAYAGKKSAPAPRRDLSGTWNAAAEGGVQAKGVLEHPALLPCHPEDEIGEQPDENGVSCPLSYTPLG